MKNRLICYAKEVFQQFYKLIKKVTVSGPRGELVFLIMKALKLVLEKDILSIILKSLMPTGKFTEFTGNIPFLTVNEGAFFLLLI
jgi:hypothetical protein